MAAGIKGEYPDNKHDGVFTGETRTVTNVDPASIGPNEARPEEVKATRFALGQATGYIAP